MVNQFQRSLLDATSEPATRASERLHRVLVAAAGRLERGTHLIVIPDRWIHFVPFAALRDSASGRYVVQDHAVSYAPSARLSTSSVAASGQRFSRSSRLLAIGNPAFDRRAFQLPYLPAADGEARRIAALYDNGILLTGQGASDRALARLVPTVDIVHFAGHAVVGRDAPQLSHLVLSSDGQSDGAVFSTEIAQWKLARVRLAILSGCSTADGKLSATEGASSLARAFFAAGVPAVVSSLWAIDDDDTAEFFVAFHRRLSQGSPAVAALRDTQIEWIGD
jgi:CHAT domain-containing protein